MSKHDLEIIEIIADIMFVSIDDILSRKKNDKIVIARHLSIYFLKKTFKYSKSELGRIFNRHPASINNSLIKIEDLLITNIGFKGVVNKCNKKIDLIYSF